MHRLSRLALSLAFTATLTTSACAQARRPYEMAPPVPVERPVGPYNVHALLGGSELTRPIPAESQVLQANGVYTLSLWVLMSADTPADTLIAGVGDATAEDSRYLGLRDGRPMLRTGKASALLAAAALPQTGWHLLAATFDGVQAHLYVDGKEAAQGALTLGAVKPELQIAPDALPAHENIAHFGGTVVQVTLLPEALDAPAVRRLAATRPDLTLLRFDEASPSWPVQTRGQAGYTAQQDPSLMPSSKAPLGRPVAKPLPPLAASALVSSGNNHWVLGNNWTLATAPDVTASPEQLSTAGFDTRTWMRATVPGTVLTTMVDRGIYPDPDFGLNNLAIPESLNKQDYWYRVEFETPSSATQAAKHYNLTFNGINYAAEVWLNGKRLGDVTGAFLRGQFDLGDDLKPSGRNALAVRISPPPHPGIPQEQSLLGGPGENGGAMVLDGPTFVATEGWDWIPAIRDRNSGIWQDVVLTATDAIRLGDPQVVTHLPLPDTTSADVEIAVPVRNVTGQPVQATVHASFEGMDLSRQVTVAPGKSTVRLTAADFPQLHVTNPRLWWPNGYGKPELYHLKLSVAANGTESDHHDTTFGIREVTYELSLFDSAGRLKRVEVSPTEAPHQLLVDVSHEGMRRRESYFYSSTLTPLGEHSPAVKPVTDEPGFTDLVIKVNGVRIASRGGNWGMDDSRKRVSREHLEPYFRLHREAGVNIIRNWVGQDTEETFYQLADENGMMVWNDFWDSTQDYNAEAQDVPLFLRNARDTVQRFRNHPSIILWCGRNEGVPQPVLNQGLIDIFREEDGTRFYSPDSNRVNLRNSGPYHYQDPAVFYSINKGFSVELGIASLSTLESFQASIAPADQWPISDAWAYHDFHWSGNGDVHPLLEAMDRQLGASTDLKDFERKSQMFNYVDHRAIFEGFNQHLWQPSSGRMLWMTQPAWPSNMWQIFSSDYDTNGSYYGVKKACEPLHVQLDLSDYTVAAVNTTGTGAGAVTVHAAVYSLANNVLLTRDGNLDLKADATQPLFQLALAPLFASEGVVLVKLEMKDSASKVISSNLYWLAGDESKYRKLNTLAPAKLTTTAHAHRDGDETVIDLAITNSGSVAALATKATLKQARSGERILPAYYSDNYVSVLPGETANITVRYPTSAAKQSATIAFRGWNVPESAIDVR